MGNCAHAKDTVLEKESPKIVMKPISQKQQASTQQKIENPISIMNTGNRSVRSSQSPEFKLISSSAFDNEALILQMNKRDSVPEGVFMNIDPQQCFKNSQVR